MKIFKYLLIAASLFSGAIVATNKTVIETQAAEEQEKILTTNPFEDLIEDEQFKIDYINGAYQFDHCSPVQFLNFSEYKYKNEYSDDFGLFVYFYNPNDLKPVDILSSNNAIQMSFGLNNTDYDRYKLIPISQSVDDIKNMFYKFRVDIGINEYNKLDSSQRVYNVSSFELKIRSESQITDTPVGNTYKYSGYAAGCNYNGESTLQCIKLGLDYINIQLHGGYVRSGMVNDKLTEAVDLHYVYFQIDNEKLRLYGEPYSVSYHYYKYNLDKGIFNIRNHDYYLSNWQTVDNAAIYGVGDPWNWVDDPGWNPWEMVERMEERYDIVFDGDIGKNNDFESVPEIGKRLVRNNEWNSEVTEDQVADLIDTYGLKYFSSTTEDDAYSGIITTTIEDIVDPTHIVVVDDPKISWIASLMNLQISGHGPFGRTQLGGNEWEDVNGFETVKSYEENDGSIYTISEKDVAEFNDLYNDSINNDKTMCLLHFDESEYWTAPIDFINPGAFSSKWEEVGYVFYPSYIENFKILTLGFRVNNKTTIIPVVCDPIRIVPGGTAPVDDRPDVPDWWDKIMDPDSNLNFKLIIGVIGGIVLIVVVIKLISSINKHRATKSQIKANNIKVKEYRDQKKEKKRNSD